MKEFKFRISADVADLEAQFKGGAKELAKFASGVEKASDKLAALTETGEYLKQMDDALAKIKNEYPDLFKKIFGSVDKNIKDALAPINKMANETDKTFDKIGTKLRDMSSGKIQGSRKEINEVIVGMEALTKAMGVKIDFQTFRNMIDDGEDVKVIVNDLIDLLKRVSDAYTMFSNESVGAAKNIKAIGGDSSLKEAAKDAKNLNKELGSTKKAAKEAKQELKKVTTDNGDKDKAEVKQVMSYEDLLKSVKKAKELSKKIDDGDDSAFDKMDSLLISLQKKFKLNEDGVAKFEEAMQDLDLTTEDTMHKLQSILGDKFPAAIQESKEETKELADTMHSVNEGLHDLNDTKTGAKAIEEAADAAKRQADEIERAKDAALKLDEALKGAGKRTESAIFYNSQTAEYGDAIKGENHKVDVDPSAWETKYDTAMHSHPFDFAAPSIEDFDLWIGHFNEFKKVAIRANKEILSLDFSSLDADGLKKIRDEYAAAVQKIEEEFGQYTSDINAMNEKFGSYDGWQNAAQQAMQNALKGLLDPNMFTNIDFGRAIESPKGIKSIIPLKEQYEGASDEVKQLVNELAKLDDLDETDEIAAKWERLAEIAPNIYKGIMHGGDWDEFKQGILVSASAIENLGEEIDEALAQETGDLESKLERLKDIADEFGKNITQRDRNSLETLIDKDNEGELTSKQEERLSDLQEKIDEADEALIAFEEQYDKIILKLENGKKVEILPNDKGLRDLYKFMDEGDGETFGGIGVEDVEFIRKAADSTEDVTNEVYEQIKSYEELNAVIKRYNELALKRVSEGVGISKQEETEMSSISNRLMQSFAEGDPDKSLDFLMKFNGVTNQILGTIEIDRIANILGIEIPQAANKAEVAVENLGKEIDKALSQETGNTDKIESKLEETNQKLREQENLYQQVRTAIKGTLEEVVGMDYTAVALEDIEREIKDGLITTLEEAIVRFKEMNNLTDDITIRPVGEYQRVADSWDYYQGNKYVSEDERVVNADEYDSLKQKSSGEDIGQEYKDLEVLRQKIAEVEQAVKDKTAAFDAEKVSVNQNIHAEIDDLKRLGQQIIEVKRAIDLKIQAFVNERKAVDSNVDAEIQKLAELKREVEAIAGQIQTIGTISLVGKQEESTSKPLDGEPLNGEQLGMDLDAATQDAKELAAAEEQVETAVEQTNDALDEQILKGKELAKQNGTLNHLQNEAKSAEKVLGKSWSDKEKENYEQLIATISEYKNDKKKLTDEEINDIRKIVEAYQLQVKTIKQANEEEEKKSKAYGLKELKNATGKKTNLEAISGNFQGSQAVTNGLENMRIAYDRLVEAQKKFNDGHEPTEDERIEYQNLTNQYNEAAKALDNLFKTSQKMNDNSRWSVPIEQSDLTDIETAMQRVIQATEKGKVKFGQFNAETGQLEYSVRRANGTWDHFTAQVDEASMAIIGLGGRVKTTNGLIRDLTSGALNQFKMAMKRFSGYDVFYRLVNATKQGIQYVREIDTALTELKKVTNETDEAYDAFLQTASKTAGVVGSTVKDITTMTAEWSRLGYSMTQAASLAESTAVLLNVSEFNDANEASEALISSIQAYGYAADESMTVVDVLNEVGNNFAVSSDGLATALQTSASALMSAGNDLNQSVALVAAANKVLQDPSQVGAALRTIALRIRGTSLKVLEEMGEETDGAIESVSKLQEKVMAISGVNILDESGAYKDTYEILKELADVWEEIGQKDPKGQAALLELLAGKNRSNALAAILTNLDDLEGAYDAALQAEGSAQKELDTYLDSIDGRVSKFTNSVQTMWMNAISSDMVKGFVDIGTTLVKVFDQMNQSIGFFPNLALIGASIIGAWKGIPALWTAITAASKAKIAATTAETIATEALNNAKAREQIMSLASLTDKQKEAAVEALLTTVKGKETIATSLNTVEKVKAALANQGIVGTNAEVIISTLGLAGANTTAAGTFTILTTAAKGFLAAYWPILAAVAGFAIVATIWDATTTSFAEAKEQLEETTDELNDTRQNIKSLNDELKTTSDRIDELNSKDKLTLSEADELDKLKAQNAELERQIALEEQREAILKNKQLSDALEAYRKDDTFKKQWDVAVTDESGNATGEFVYDVDEVEYNLTNFESAKKAIEEAEKDLLIMLEKANKDGIITSDEAANIESARENIERLREEAEVSENVLLDIMSEREELYGDLDFFYGDNLTEEQKEWNTALTKMRTDMHRVYIATDTTGKAVTNAFKEISGRQFFQDELKLIQTEVGLTGEKLLEMYTADAASGDPYGMHGFIQTLIDTGVIADATEDELQKVVDKAILLADGNSDIELANKKLARSQKRLEYIKLAKQLHSYTKNVKGLTDAQKDEIKQIKTKMSVLSAEIDAYDILGSQISEAKQSFEEFSKAQEADTESDLTDDVSSMLQTVIEGYQSAEMGSEAFKSAFTSLIPESVYADIDTLQGKYEAAAKYISETLSDYFKIEYDDEGAISSIEVTTKNVQNFIEDAKSKGLLNFANGVWEVTETDFEGFAKKMGITEEMLVAIGEQMDKIDADWITGDLTSFFDSFEMGIEAELYNDVKALSELDSQLIDGTITVEEYTKKYQELTNAVEVNTNKAIENIKRYNEGSAEVVRLTARLEEEKKNLQDMQNSETATDQDIQNQTNLVNALITQLGEAIKKKGELSTIEITVVQEHVDSQMEELKNKWSNTTFSLPVMIDGKLVENELIKLGEDGKYVVETDIGELSEEDIDILNKYAELANIQSEINLTVNNSEEEENKLKELNELVNELETTLTNLSVEVDTTDATNKISLLKEEIKTLEDKVVTITTVNETVNKTRGGGLLSWLGFAKGTAYADGNWGAGVSTNRALVGELGPELRVRNGKYELIGEDGAEFTDVRPSDIIFNHKQTEDLLKNGHISGRGKAYADGKFYRINHSNKFSAPDINTSSLVNSLGNATNAVNTFQNTVLDVTTSLDDNNQEGSKWYQGWFSKGEFEDGWQFGDITKTTIGTIADVESNLRKGLLNIVEGVVDVGAYATGAVGGMFGADELKKKAREFIAKDLIDDKIIDDITKETSLAAKLILGKDSIDEASLIGEKSDSLVQSAGQIAGTVGLQAVGVPWYVTSGVTSFGNGVDSAFKDDASYTEAAISGAINAGAEILTEKIGGISFGGGTLADSLSDSLTKEISNEFVKKLTKFGISDLLLGEGSEEVFSEAIGRFGQWMTYQDDKTLNEMIFSKDAFDSYLESYIGGFILGEGNNIIKNIGSSNDGKADLTSYHNIWRDFLNQSIDNGGFVSPSIAVKKNDMPHTEFGDSTFVFSLDSIDPEVDKRNKLYGADAWTPTQTKLKMNAVFNESMTEQIVDDIKKNIGSDYVTELFSPSVEEFKTAIRDADGSIYDAYAHDLGMQTSYAMSNNLISGVPTLDGSVDTKTLKSQLSEVLDTDSGWRAYKVWLANLSDTIIESYDTPTNQDILNNMAKQPATAKPFKLSTNGDLVVPAVEYGSMRDAYRNSNRLTSDPSLDIKSVSDKFINFANEIKNLTDNDLSIVVDAINKSFNGRYSADLIQESFAEQSIDITKKQAEKLQKLYQQAVELPTEYFESKPNRVVSLDEVVGAVIPTDLGSELLQKMVDAGLNIVPYESGNMADRIAKTDFVNMLSKTTLNDDAQTKLNEATSEYIKAIKEYHDSIADNNGKDLETDNDTSSVLKNAAENYNNVIQSITDQIKQSQQFNLHSDYEEEDIIKHTNYEVTGTGQSVLTDITTSWANITGEKFTDYIIRTQYEGNGAANADGVIGSEKTENALVGELGPEMLVRGNRWNLIGENGAEFTNIKKNDIIFNHKQTEKLLRNGHINSRGKAYAGGKAYSGTFGTIYPGGAIESMYGGKVPDYFPRIDTLQNLGHIIEDASKDAKDEFDELIDWFEILTEEIDHQIAVYEAQLDNAVGIKEKSGIYAGLSTLEYKKLAASKEGQDLYLDEAKKYLNQIDTKYKELAKNGAIGIHEFVGEANEAQVEAINNYRDAISKAYEQELQEQESINRIAELRVEKLQMISDEYDNQTISVEHQNSRVQAHIDLLEEQGERISENHYKQMIAHTEEIIELKKAKKAAMELELSNALASGDVEKGSSAYYEMVSAINDVDLEILELTTDIESFNNSIRDLRWENFDRIVEAVANLADESENLRELLGDDSDMVDELGEWTAEGVTSLGLLAQEMENAEYRAKLFADEIEWLNENWEKEGYSVDEYNEKLQELKDGQYDAISAYEDAKDAIIDLNKTRIDAIKDGIQKEIDAYEELIEKQKESLQAKKDEHDWAKTIEGHTDEIASIQRQIDALAGDASAFAAAKRKQLEEELAAAEEELNEAYYDREIEMQQEALDKELELYTENKEQEIEGWEEYLEDEQKVLNDSFNAVSANSQLIHKTLQTVADTYGITISDSITKPWKNGQTAIADYSTKFDSAASGYMTQLNGIRDKLLELQRIADITADALAFDVKPNYDDDSGKYEEPKKDNSGAASGGGSKNVSVGSSVTVSSSATNFSRDGGNGTKMQSWVPGGTFTVMQVSGDEVLIGKDGGYTGWVKAKDLVGYNTSSSGGGSKGGSSGSGTSSNKTYTSTGGTYTVTSTKGVSFIQSASTGDKMTGGDGSTWVKNANGTVTVTTKDGKKHNIKAHAKGTTGVKADELAWIDENGLEEIVMHAQGGKLAYLTKGSSVIPHDISENLMELGKVDPKTWIDKNRPTTVPQSFVAHNNNFDLKFGSLINIEHADKDSIPEIQAAVQKQLDSYMKNLNAGIKRYAR